MSHSLSFVIIVLVIIFAVVASQYLHKRHHEYKMADIEKAVRSAYAKGVDFVTKKQLVDAVKKYFHCSAKEALYIIGVARRKKLVDISGEYVALMV